MHKIQKDQVKADILQIRLSRCESVHLAVRKRERQVKIANILF